MAPILLILFVVVPLVEIAAFIQVGQLIGLWPTLATVILTAFIGTALLRPQGMATWARARREIEGGAMPVRELLDGICLIVAGALLLTPGFVTDAIGFALMVPPVRAVLGRWFIAMLMRHGEVRIGTAGPPPGAPPGGAPGPAAGPGDQPGPIIDSEDYEVHDDDRESGGWTRRR